MICDSLLYNIRLRCNVIFFPTSGQGRVKGPREFENFNLEHIVILKTEHKELQLLREKRGVLFSRPCVLLSPYPGRTGFSVSIGGERELSDISHLPEDRFPAVGVRK